MVSKSFSLIFSVLLIISVFLCFSTRDATSRRLYAAVEGGYSGVPMSIPEAGSLHEKGVCGNKLQNVTFMCSNIVPARVRGGGSGQGVLAIMNPRAGGQDAENESLATPAAATAFSHC
nr:hypothetical protein Iba_chr04fCG10430 [Ipomoea batatas]